MGKACLVRLTYDKSMNTIAPNSKIEKFKPKFWTRPLFKRDGNLCCEINHRFTYFLNGDQETGYSVFPEIFLNYLPLLAPPFRI